MKKSTKVFLWLTWFVICCFVPPLFALTILFGISLFANKLATNFLNRKKKHHDQQS